MEGGVVHRFYEPPHWKLTTYLSVGVASAAVAVWS